MSAREPVVKSESVTSRTLRHVEEKDERTSPSQNQNISTYWSNHLPPPPLLPGVGRHHLGQGSRPGGKLGMTAEPCNKAVIAYDCGATPEIARQPRS